MSSSPVHSTRIVNKHQSVSVNIPEFPASKRSLEVSTLEGKSYTNWTRENREDAFDSLQKTVALWKSKGVAVQHLTYGKQTANEPFRWEIVPFHRTNANVLDRMKQQLKIFLKLIFPAKSLSESSLKQRLEVEKGDFDKFSFPKKSVEKVSKITAGDDAFCMEVVINKQRVLEGKTINVLYSYAPIGCGKEKLHFLITTKAHRPKFSDLSKEEYLEAMSLAKKLMDYFKKTRKAENFYFIHRTGIETGQTVSHWHMHLIVGSTQRQDNFIKQKLLEKIPFGYKPMKPELLKMKVSALFQEFKQL